MRVSIITVTFNSAATIRQTIESVQRQEDVEVEHVIVDGGSRDGTQDIVRSYPHITRFISEPDKGIYDAMNKGLAMATGDVVGILNSDDMYAHAGVLRKVMERFEEPSVEATYADLIYVDAADTDRVVRRWKAGEYHKGGFLWGWMPPHPTFFVRRGTYERLGVFRLNLETSSDYELMLRFIHLNGIRIAYIPEVLVCMRSGGASNITLKARLTANRKDREAWTLNGLRPHWFTLYLKPLRKLTQFLSR